MANKTEISASKDGSEFIITKTSDKGAVQTETLHADKALTQDQCARVLSSAIKTQNAFRSAALTFLGMVYQQQALNGYAGSADKETGKVSNEFKSAVRDAETATVRALVEAGAIKAKDEQAIQTYLSALREDKNYSNAKVTANRYFGIVGANCVTQSGYIVPVPVMQAQIREHMPVQTVDRSMSARLRAILQELTETDPDTSDVIESLSLVSVLRDKLIALGDKNAEIATNQHAATGNVVTATTAALQAAMAPAIGGGSNVSKFQRAPAPEAEQAPAKGKGNTKAKHAVAAE